MGDDFNQQRFHDVILARSILPHALVRDAVVREFLKLEEPRRSAFSRVARGLRRAPMGILSTWDMRTPQARTDVDGERRGPGRPPRMTMEVVRRVGAEPGAGVNAIPKGVTRPQRRSHGGTPHSARSATMGSMEEARRAGM